MSQFDEATMAALERIDNSFAATEAKVYADVNSVPNGEYEILILASYVEMANNGKLVGNFAMEVCSGESAGSPLEKTHWLQNDNKEREEKNVAFYKGDLEKCGLDTKGKGIMQTIPLLPSLAGTRMLVYASHYTDNKGKDRLDIKFKKLLAKPEPGAVADVVPDFTDPFADQ